MSKLIQFINNNIILSISWIILASMLLFFFIQKKINSINSVSNNKAISLINKNNAIVIDLRDKKDYINGHIINSLNINFDNFNKISLSNLLKNKKNPLIITCYNGSLSKKFLKKFIKNKCIDVYILKNGICGWKSDNLPLIKL
ncbi:yibN [Wigglesworthia glossinidia endosymbiont of Glossina brevipalpis]|uniref:YibN protein n=1 Tax=Wigglesworthia glossinidia brevipalpis TaxID=36870 RepID=Q8D214_WIGBR|nr:yibN [Wigglesworthia glossinidia endosymbiont of Glossina brevipalpis]